MASDKNPKERAVKKKKSQTNKAAKTAVAAIGAAAAAAAITSSKSSKSKKGGVIVMLLCLVLGLAAGFFGLGLVTESDGFEMAGDDFVEVYMYEEYVEQGATAVFFGKEYTVEVNYYYREDISFEAQACTSVDTAVPGFYYAVYQTEAPVYKSIDLIRTVEIIRVENDGQED